ncbi:TRAP transporter small permease [Futiania mangrovi]|uniref:TRAP transporter small permease protein n=1 Tax=Futiania mangrovi TaxID=2959716 RepID=A0A9J6PI92_9PROT|nr:TRAP transporter small permease [Futiania mangrovii]MCP1336287.1 TRAP transporter small permease [Futiania mangrovii]
MREGDSGRGRRVFAVLDLTIHSVERVLRFIGACMMLAVMVIVAGDVFARYFFNAPFSWSYDLISIYLMVGIFFFFLSDTFRYHGHVAVDIVQNRLGRRARHASQFVAGAVSCVVFGLALWVGVGRAWSSYVVGEALAGAIAWPMWVALSFVPLGISLLFLRLVLATLGHAVSFALERDFAPLPPLAGTEEAP